MENNFSVTVVHGDITQVAADALMTLINTGGLWFGGVDGAIQSVGGAKFYQDVLRALTPHTTDGDVWFSDGAAVSHRGKFKHVLFVFDDLLLPLAELVRNGMIEAYRQGLTSVSMPMFRTGVMAGIVEKTPIDVAKQMCNGIMAAVNDHPHQPMDITIVVYGGDNKRTLALRQAFHLPE